LGPSPAFWGCGASDAAVEEIDDLAGLARTDGLKALDPGDALMFSLAGIPPLAGFYRQICRVSRSH
jgi:NADH:ubiquinone oxidoreductase subunit 2 (subunit N)